MDLAKLEQRITRLEAIEEIKQLKARYCEICDHGHDPEEIITIFTEDGIWEGEGIAQVTGHAEIKALFSTFQETISFSQHMVQNPIIELNGDRASARWYFFGMFTFAKNDQARWQAARYHEDYVKAGGIWKISHLRIAPPVMSARYETGWHNGKSRRAK